MTPEGPALHEANAMTVKKCGYKMWRPNRQPAVHSMGLHFCMSRTARRHCPCDTTCCKQSQHLKAPPAQWTPRALAVWSPHDGVEGMMGALDRSSSSSPRTYDHDHTLPSQLTY